LLHSRSRAHAHLPTGARAVETMNQIIWLVGLVVIVLFIAGYFGLR